MSSVDALDAAVANVRESLRAVAASFASAHHEGGELAGALDQVVAEGRSAFCTRQDPDSGPCPPGTVKFEDPS